MSALLCSSDNELKALVTKNFDQIFSVIDHEKCNSFIGIFIDWLAKGERNSVKRLSLDVLITD